MKINISIIDRGALMMIGHWPPADTMKKNMGIIDRALRVVVVIIIGVLFLVGRLHGWWGIGLSIVAVVFLLTALLAKCPMYTLFGLTSCHKSCPGPREENMNEAQETNS